MFEEMTYSHRAILKRLILLIGLSLIGMSNAPLTGAQTEPGSVSRAPSLTIEDLYRSPGETLAEGNNTVPFGKLKLKSYKLEEITLGNPIELSSHGNRETVQKIIRLTITGESFQPGDYTIWLGEESLTDVRRSPTELTTIVFDRSNLEDGISIAVSYETLGDHSRTILPETLYIPAQSKLAPSSAHRNRVSRIKAIKPEGAPNSQPYIEIELTSEDGFPARNALRIFQIGTLETYGVGPSEDGQNWLIRIPSAQFAELKDNVFVFEKTEHGKKGLRGARNFGRLNKALLEP